MRHEIVGRDPGSPLEPNTPAPLARAHARWWIWIVLVGVCVVVCGGWVFWRYTAPVQVRLASSVQDLPFDVETIPPVVEARPDEMVSVVYRIRNNDIQPLEAFGSIEIDPPSASRQIQVFLTQCGGLNTYEHSYTQDYRVFFRVGAAGLMGAQQITLRHNFTRASPPRP